MDIDDRFDNEDSNDDDVIPMVTYMDDTIISEEKPSNYLSDLEMVRCRELSDRLSQPFNLVYQIISGYKHLIVKNYRGKLDLRRDIRNHNIKEEE